ncbi:MAG: hypothetical protein Q8P41_28340 [Pseudomonadota bacterium]|nr:hypothetical protein [Pseudomonadota bacterium]
MAITPPTGLDLPSLVGTWHVVATTLPFWRGKRAPVITYGALDGPGLRWSDTVAYEAPGWLGGGWKRHRVVGVDVGDPAVPGRFRWRGAGVLGLLTSDWSYLAVDPAGQWTATWFARATFGVTPEGMDVCARRPDLDPAVIDGVIADLAKRPELAHLGGWFRPER